MLGYGTMVGGCDFVCLSCLVPGRPPYLDGSGCSCLSDGSCTQYRTVSNVSGCGFPRLRPPVGVRGFCVLRYPYPLLLGWSCGGLPGWIGMGSVGTLGVVGVRRGYLGIRHGGDGNMQLGFVCAGDGRMGMYELGSVHWGNWRDWDGLWDL